MRLSSLCIVICFTASLIAASSGESSYSLVADAGSTGTRMYMFHELSAEGASRLEIKDLGKGPALSSFQDKPGDAVAAVRAQLDKARAAIPEELHGSVPLAVFATAGMRLVQPDKAAAVYEGLRSGLLKEGYPFDQSALQARTISGREEGTFAMIAANYLARHIDISMDFTGEGLLGVLDLGGSSTQIAVPSVRSKGPSMRGSLDEDHAYIRSFLSLGMERMRQRTYERLVNLSSVPTTPSSEVVLAKRAVPNPCAFFGYTEVGEVWRGTGEAKACMDAVVETLRKERQTCNARLSPAGCLPTKPVHAQTGKAPSLLLISGYFFVTDFARWWLEHPGARPKTLQSLNSTDVFSTPTISELRSAAAAVCAEPWEKVMPIATSADTRHQFTSPNKVPHRCFELSYIVALLSYGYGFQENARIFRIVGQLDGSDVEWTLGAYLHGRAVSSPQGISSEDVSPQSWSTDLGRTGTAPVAYVVLPLLFASVIIVPLYLRFRRRSGDASDLEDPTDSKLA